VQRDAPRQVVLGHHAAQVARGVADGVDLVGRARAGQNV